MKLKAYLRYTGLLQVELAARLKVSQGRLSHWVLGRHSVPPKMIPAIEKATGGKVTRRDLLPLLYKKKRKR